MEQSISRLITQRSQNVQNLARGLPRLSEVLGNYVQRLDLWADRLNNSLPNLITKYEKRLASLSLRPQILLNDVRKLDEKLKTSYNRARLAMEIYISRRADKTENLAKLFDSYNYRNVLKRGFALVKGQDGKLVKSAALAKGSVEIEFADGIKGAKINE